MYESDLISKIVLHPTFIEAFSPCPDEITIASYCRTQKEIRIRFNLKNMKLLHNFMNCQIIIKDVPPQWLPIVITGEQP